MSDNWIVSNLENAFSTWNDKMAEIWSLITTSSQNFKGGTIWNVISGINGDEFVCISESNPLPYISQFKDTIGFIDKEKWYKLSVSIGYAPYHHKYSTTACDILRRADELMQRNKKKK